MITHLYGRGVDRPKHTNASLIAKLLAKKIKARTYEIIGIGADVVEHPATEGKIIDR